MVTTQNSEPPTQNFPDIPVSPAADAIAIYRAVTDQEPALRARYAGPFVDYALDATYRDMRATLGGNSDAPGSDLMATLCELVEMQVAQQTFESRTGIETPTGVLPMEANIATQHLQVTRELLEDAKVYAARPPLIPPRWLPPVRFALLLEATRGPAQGVVQSAMQEARDLRARLPGTLPWAVYKGRRLASTFGSLMTLFLG